MSTDTSEAAAAPVDPAAGLPSGWRLRRSLALFAVVIGLIVLDLWSKAAVFDMLDSPGAGTTYGTTEHNVPRVFLAGDWLGFMLNLNYGAAFGQGSGSQGFLVIARIVASLVLTVLIVRTAPRQRVYLGALVLILSGALGNLYDNLFYEPHSGLAGYVPGRNYGPVRDFIDVYFSVWDWHFPTFNVADSCITVGAVLLLASGLFGGGDVSAKKA